MSAVDPNGEVPIALAAAAVLASAYAIDVVIQCLFSGSVNHEQAIRNALNEFNPLRKPAEFWAFGGAVGSGNWMDAAIIAGGVLPGVPSIRGSKGNGPSNHGANSDARFIGDSNGNIVDTNSTPRGSYDQPDGGRTDILQAEDHGAGFSHTHDPIRNTNPKTGETFVNGTSKPGRPVSKQDVDNITSGDATRSPPKRR